MPADSDCAACIFGAGPNLATTQNCHSGFHKKAQAPAKRSQELRRIVHGITSGRNVRHVLQVVAVALRADDVRARRRGLWFPVAALRSVPIFLPLPARKKRAGSETFGDVSQTR